MGEAGVINSVTKFRQKDTTIKKMAERAIGHPIDIIQIKEMAGGLCNAVYLVEADGTKMVLKVAPDPRVKIMRHEKNYVPTEAEMLIKIHEQTDIPMPELLYFDDSGEICPVPYFFMSFLSGKPLNQTVPFPSEREVYQIKKEIGRITRKINEIKAPYFGIPAIPETFSDSNGEFVIKLFQMLLQDADDKKIEIPDISSEELLRLIERRKTLLDNARQAVYAHTDTWNGNIMIQDNKLSGLVDFAAVIFGDPLISHDFHDFGDSPSKAFLEGYGIDFPDESQKQRILVYKVWHCLGMIVERGYRDYEDPQQYAWVTDIFRKNVLLLKNE